VIVAVKKLPSINTVMFGTIASRWQEETSAAEGRMDIAKAIFLQT
jgi:hypothetical protein